MPTPPQPQFSMYFDQPQPGAPPPAVGLPVADTVWSEQMLSDYWYDRGGMVTAYARDEGLLALPVCSANPVPPEVVNVHAPYSTKRVRFATGRVGTCPTVPDPDVDDGQSVLLHSVAAPSLPVVEPNGNTRDWSMSGEYTYVMLNAVGAGDDLCAGSSPADVFQVEDNVYPADHFDDGLTPQEVPPGEVNPPPAP